MVHTQIPESIPGFGVHRVLRPVISLGKFQLISDAFNPPAQAADALSGFFSGTDFVVIEGIVFTDICR